MSRNGSGTYSLPAGQPVADGTTISATVFNALTSDLETALTQSLSADGQTPITASLKGVNGSNAAPLYSFTASIGTGLYSPATDQVAVAAGGVLTMKWAANVTTNYGTFALDSTTSPILLNGSAGTAAQVLTSAGAGATPTWSTPASGVSLSGTNTWTGAQTFTNSLMKLLGSSTGATTFTSANAGASNYTMTIPAVTDTFAVLGANTFTAAQNITAVNKGSISAATVTFDFTAANVQYYTATGSTVTWAFSNVPASGTFGEMLIVATNQGNFTFAAGATVNWELPTSPVTYTTTFATYLAANLPRIALATAGVDMFYLWTTLGVVYGKLV